MKLYDNGIFLADGEISQGETLNYKGKTWTKNQAKKGTIANSILEDHQVLEDEDYWHLKFDSITSHDITYVGIIQTARASGMKEFPLPYVMTNCHNSLCAVGGTINEDDHKFALSAAKKYGGIYVPPNLAVIHSYNRETMAGCGKMILGSDSHTRYGALGTMAVGEGGGELAKQLLKQTYDIKKPPVVGIYLKGEVPPYIGPHDISLQLIKEVFDSAFVKNCVLEFIGPAIKDLPVEFRNAIDVMTTETTCWSSIWETDERVREYLEIHERPGDYRELNPAEVAYYDKFIEIDLSQIKPSIALPFHPSNVVTIEELKENPYDILKEAETKAQKLYEGTDVKLDFRKFIKDGKVYADQGLIVGCSGGTFDNISYAAQILDGADIGNGAFSMSVYPGSQPAYLELVKNSSVAKLMEAGVTVKSAFCGPCFGAGDTPGNGELSLRHATRNFPNRDGSKPTEGQYTAVCLMDGKSIAATAKNQGFLTGADEIDLDLKTLKYHYDSSIYEKRVYGAYKKANPEEELVFGPNIKDWPEMEPLTDHLLIKIASHIDDPVTTTDELIPSGETASYRSNPLRLAEFTLSRKDPSYVNRAKAVKEEEEKRIKDGTLSLEKEIYEGIKNIIGDLSPEDLGIGSAIFSRKPGDGSAREQAASCQKVLGGWANFAQEYATKRYRSNLINWGILPFIADDPDDFSLGDLIFIPNIRERVEGGESKIRAYNLNQNKEIELDLEDLSKKERDILLAGCLINFNRSLNE